MTGPSTPDTRTRLTLEADTAADLMSANPISLRAEATVRQALALLTEHNYGAAPVIDEAGRPIGVLSRSDLLVHDREKGEHPDAERDDATRVRDLMTPTVLSVKPGAPVRQVVGEMLSLKVHHLFVVDNSGALVGVISPYDILRYLA